MNGTGVRTYAHGDRYEGQWLRGEMYGKGVYTYADGSYYDGEYLATKAHPKNGCIFPVVDGLRHGNGIRVWCSGNKYVGQWVSSEMEGRGVFTTGDGECYEGDFVGSR